jgi:ankyrin repeat protein
VVVEILIKAGADVNKGALSGVTPLSMAACKGHLDVVRTTLIEEHKRTRGVPGTQVVRLGQAFAALFNTAAVVGGCTSSIIQLTHSLNAPVVNP